MNDFLVWLVWFKNLWYPPIKFLFEYPIVLSLVSLAFSMLAFVNANKLQKELEKLKKNQDNKLRFKFYLVDGDQKKELTKMEQIGVGGVAKIEVVVVDKFENKTKLDGKPVWKNLNEDLGSHVESEDGFSVEVKNAGKMGIQKFELEGDADLGEGVIPVVGSVELEWVPGIAVSFKAVVMEMKPAPEEPAPLKK